MQKERERGWGEDDRRKFVTGPGKKSKGRAGETKRAPCAARWTRVAAHCPQTDHTYIIIYIYIYIYIGFINTAVHLPQHDGLGRQHDVLGPTLLGPPEEDPVQDLILYT
jgi:hypothetical protein